ASTVRANYELRCRMASLNDLAGLIAHHRAAAERLFDSEIARLRLAYGDRVVTKAMGLVERQGDQRAAISVSAARLRHAQERAAERGAQRAFRQQHDAETGAPPRLPPGWR